jgi:hypothetical protein
MPSSSKDLICSGSVTSSCAERIVEMEKRLSVEKYFQYPERHRRMDREYVVRESWLVDPVECAVEILNFESGVDRRRIFAGRAPVESHVLPGLTVPVGEFFL